MGEQRTIKRKRDSTVSISWDFPRICLLIVFSFSYLFCLYSKQANTCGPLRNDSTISGIVYTRFQVRRVIPIGREKTITATSRDGFETHPERGSQKCLFVKGKHAKKERHTAMLSPSGPCRRTKFPFFFRSRLFYPNRQISPNPCAERMGTDARLLLPFSSRQNRVLYWRGEKRILAEKSTSPLSRKKGRLAYKISSFKIWLRGIGPWALLSFCKRVWTIDRHVNKRKKKGKV